jgi:DNA adenine methylase
MMLNTSFPCNGSKSLVADIIWRALGSVPNYVEPLCGSAAVLLARPNTPTFETINDLDGFICNAYRALKYSPEVVTRWASWPTSDRDRHARHAWLKTQRDELPTRLEGNPDYYDAKIAGWWICGVCNWIGERWCSGKQPWQIVDGQLPHLGNATIDASLSKYFALLSSRLRHVRIICGDWRRILGLSVTTKLALTAIFFDPPYRLDEHSFGYAVGSEDTFEESWTWALVHGNDPCLRIVLAGYDDGRVIPKGWNRYRWKAHGGYGSQRHGRGGINCRREILYCSPHCLPISQQLDLFGTIGDA